MASCSMHAASVHLRSLLVYSVLTASTIGPGTVAMCAKSGSEYDTALLWCVIVAAAVAWVMQEGSARLTLASERTLGQCLRALTSGRRSLRALRYLLLCFIVLGSFAYTCNNFAGTMAAVDMVVGDAGARTAINLALAPACVALLLAGNAGQISSLLSAVVLLMIGCFGLIVGRNGAPPRPLLHPTPAPQAWLYLRTYGWLLTSGQTCRRRASYAPSPSPSPSPSPRPSPSPSPSPSPLPSLAVAHDYGS